MIRTPESADLIDGVVVRPFDLWPDDRGYFLEVARMGQGLAETFPNAVFPHEAFPQETTQVSAALSYPGTIKAFHFHLHQTDLWAPAAGMFQVALVDLRPESRTYGVKNTLYAGTLKPWRILIPPGVGHGYKVIGAEPAMLVYVTNRWYNPQDEGRIPYDDASIAYDWETQHK
jgi:dTDP-4-dehydrorhamnose 3,5-epimerase